MAMDGRNYGSRQICRHSVDAKQVDNDRAGKQEFVCGQLAERLRKYCRGGEYGKWFRGRMNINFERPFVMLDWRNSTP